MKATVNAKIQNQNGNLNGIETLLAILIVVGIVWLLSGWFTMLGLGILHAHLSPAVPLLGWKDSLWTALGVWLIFGLRGSGSKS